MKERRGKAKEKGKFRPAVFIVTYRKDERGIYYFLLKRKLHWIGWEFPKGGIEKSETLEKAVRRECFEETGLKPIKIKKFNINGKYLYQKQLEDRKPFIGQTYELFSAQVSQNKNQKIKLDKKEHSSYLWLPFKRALKLLKWKNQKRCLGIVNKTLTKN